jgi:hypothetical protein
MSTISMHSASVPVFQLMLGNMLAWLDRAQAHAEARKFDADNYLGLRLAPDMLPLSMQIRIACDNAKRCCARLAGIEAPVHADDETTLEQLRARIRSVLTWMASVPAAQIDGSEDREIELPQRSGEPLRFTGQAFLTNYALPNFYFHTTTTYAILRHAGVDLGKRHYLRGA